MLLKSKPDPPILEYTTDQVVYKFTNNNNNDDDGEGNGGDRVMVPYVFGYDFVSGVNEIEVEEIVEKRHACLLACCLLLQLQRRERESDKERKNERNGSYQRPWVVGCLNRNEQVTTSPNCQLKKVSKYSKYIAI